MAELIPYRTYNSKTHDTDTFGNPLPDGQRRVEVCSGPVHYEDYADGQFKDIVLAFADDAGGTRGAQHLASGNRMSTGMAKDKKHAKMVGLRFDSNHQFEISQNSIVLNGVEKLSGTEFASISKLASGREIELGVDANTSVCHELRWTGVVGYVKTTLALTGFAITEEFHLKGFSCTNQLVGSAYIAENKKFNFKDDTTNEWAFAIKAPVMWDSAAMPNYSSEVIHSLFLSGGKLLYEKTPTGAGVAWLSTAVGAVSIDASVEVNGSAGDGYIALENADWATARNAVAGTAAYPNYYLASLDSSLTGGLYRMRRTHSFFTLSIPESATINSAELKFTIHSKAGTATMMAQKSTSPDPIVNNSYDDFTGASYGVVTATAVETVTTLLFNSIGLADIVKNGVTKICTRQNSSDFLDVAPTDFNWVLVYTQDETSAGKRPVLSIVYTPAASFTGKVIVIL